MTIGEKIKNLRHINDVTQEKLAEYLNITYQSISKWENNNAMPDISLVVPLANFFGVSIDELFDRGFETQNQEIEAYIEKTQRFMGEGLILENITLWREAVQKYPKNYTCLSYLAWALWYTVNITQFQDSHEENALEAAAICERILRDCTENINRGNAISMLVAIYSNKTLSLANEEKAVEYARMAGSVYTSSEMLLEGAYFTEEGKKKAKILKHHNVLMFMDFLCSRIYLFSDCESKPEEKIIACETAIKLWSILIYDDNFLFYHGRIADIYITLSENYAILNKHDETLTNIRKALSHAKSYDNLPEGELHYTALFVSCATSNIYNSKSMEQEIKFSLNNPCYNFLCNDPEFSNLRT